MEKKNLNEELKKQEQMNKSQEEKSINADGEMTLDSTERVKVLSPGRLVFNRFIRNKLAIVGSAILLFMFIFAFAFPLFYGYTQTQIFYKYDKVITDYAIASERTEYTTMMVDSQTDIHYSIKNNLNANITKMITDGVTELTLDDGAGNQYLIQRVSDNIYSLSTDEREEICSISGYTSFAEYNSIVRNLKYTTADTLGEDFTASVDKAISGGKEEFSYGEDTFRLTAGKKGNYTIERRGSGVEYVGSSLGSSFETALMENLENGSFEYKGSKYSIATNGDNYTVYLLGDQVLTAYMTTYVFDSYSNASFITDEFKLAAIAALSTESDFEVSGVSYEIKDEEDEIFIYDKADKTNPVAVFSNFVVRAYNGEDTLSFEYKEKTREVIEGMIEAGTKTATFEWEIPQLTAEGAYEYDENGALITEPTEITMTSKKDSYVMTCEQVTYLIDIYNGPSSEHWFGTDGDGMDVFARMMYGGRISLLVCFIVIIIETVLGVIMGGIAGYFGGWIDNLIMRMVDIFYCIPSMPILIIIGALFDAQKMDAYVRLAWLMFILGVLGWAGVARLVRGQILSLREQEFMTAAEAVGLSTKRRIFRHLVPNVMPQLIVTASSGLGSIIITESTLSFLGLGVKHPLATWGTMINSVTRSSESMIAYTYIWIPVGLLICLTVIAFNFVGDGLRDAFDPKMKR